MTLYYIGNMKFKHFLNQVEISLFTESNYYRNFNPIGTYQQLLDSRCHDHKHMPGNRCHGQKLHAF
jgi:hypothetical protein